MRAFEEDENKLVTRAQRKDVRTCAAVGSTTKVIPHLKNLCTAQANSSHVRRSGAVGSLIFHNKVIPHLTNLSTAKPIQVMYAAAVRMALSFSTTK